MLNLRDIIQTFEPYKTNLSDTPLTTLTQILDCYERSSKLIQSLVLES